ncbi:MAG: hypothetical protein ACR2IK_16090 [Chloroflexota bacterium]
MTDQARTVPGLRWWRAVVALLTLTAFLFLYLEVRLSQEGEPLIVPIAVILVLNVLVAAAMVVQPRAWLIWPALLLLIVGFLGDVSHQVEAIVQPDGVEHVAFAIVATVVQVAAIIAAAGCAFAGQRHPHAVESVS